MEKNYNEENKRRKEAVDKENRFLKDELLPPTRALKTEMQDADHASEVITKTEESSS